MLDKEIYDSFDFTVELSDETVDRPARNSSGKKYSKLLKAFIDSDKPTLKLSCPTPGRAGTVSCTIRRIAEKKGFHVTCWKRLNEVWVIKV